MDLREFTAAVKTRVPLSKIVGTSVALKPHGTERFIGLCPFHQDRNPSFHVSDDKGFYYCFACQAKGDHFRFLQEMRHLDFKEAADELAGLAGMAPFPFKAFEKPEAKENTREKRELGLELLSRTQKYYQKLLESNYGESARKYITSRKIPEPWVSQFGLGFAPAAREQEIYQRLSNSEMLTAEELGIVRNGDHGRYDLFRGRLMFPIFDEQGRAVGFGGRSIDGSEPKYLNSIDSFLFKKGELLYGFMWAKDIARKTGHPVVLVEGYLDVHACLHAGIPAVAPLGTGFTPIQARRLKNFKGVILGFDDEKSGHKASDRAMLALLQEGVFPELIRWGEKDPFDLLIQKGQGALIEIVSKRVPALEEYAKRMISESSKKSLNERVASWERLSELPITPESVRSQYLVTWRQTLGLSDTGGAGVAQKTFTNQNLNPVPSSLRLKSRARPNQPRWLPLFWEKVHGLWKKKTTELNWPTTFLPMDETVLNEAHGLLTGTLPFPEDALGIQIFSELEFQREAVPEAELERQIEVLALTREREQIMGQLKLVQPAEAEQLLSRQIQVNKLIQNLTKGAHGNKGEK